MPKIDSTTRTIQAPDSEYVIGRAHVAAAALLARYRGRTLHAYRNDLLGYFQWAADANVAVLEAPSAHRAVPHLSRTPRPGRVDHRPTSEHRVRSIPFRPH